MSGEFAPGPRLAGSPPTLRGRFDEVVRTGGIFIALAAIVLLASLVSPNFLTEGNWLNILRTVTLVGILAVGQTFVAIAGGLGDVSAGSVLALSAVLALGLQGPLGTVPAIMFALAAGVLVGVVNGVLAGVLRANPIVATIGSGVVVSGIALMYTAGRTQFGSDPVFSAFGTGSTFGVPNIVLCFGVIVVIGQVVLWTTSLGRRLFATGGNYEAARASAIGVRRVMMAAFVVSGVTAATAGVITAALLGQVNYDTGSSFTFTSIAAVAVGGTSLFGGSGSVLRTVVGVVIIGVLNNIVVLAGWPLNVQVIVTGAVIIVAVAADAWLRRRGT
jgi:ribose transport system permease protein